MADQTFGDLEVVMVDDGSTDDSAGHRPAFADRTAAFRLVRQENSGLGARPQHRVRHADPAQPLSGVRRQRRRRAAPRVRAAGRPARARSGSDFATGNVLRLRPRRAATGLAAQAHGDRTVLRTHITRDLALARRPGRLEQGVPPLLLGRHAFAFPEGMLYEDIPRHPPRPLPRRLRRRPAGARLPLARSGRARSPGGVRIVRGVRDRIAAVTGQPFPADPDQHPRTADKRDYDRSCSPTTCWYFIEALPMGGDEYREVFLDGANDFPTSVDPAVLDGLPLSSCG